MSCWHNSTWTLQGHMEKTTFMLKPPWKNAVHSTKTRNGPGVLENRPRHSQKAENVHVHIRPPTVPKTTQFGAPEGAEKIFFPPPFLCTFSNVSSGFQGHPPKWAPIGPQMGLFSAPSGAGCAHAHFLIFSNVSDGFQGHPAHGAF